MNAGVSAKGARERIYCFADELVNSRNVHAECIEFVRISYIQSIPEIWFPSYLIRWQKNLRSLFDKTIPSFSTKYAQGNL